MIILTQWENTGNIACPLELKKSLYQLKEYGSRRILTEFSKIDSKRQYLTLCCKRFEEQKARPKAWEQQTEARAYWRECDRCGWTGWPAKSKRPDTNTYRSTRQISRKTGLTQSRVIQIIHRDLDLKCRFRLPTRLLPITISFSYTHILQGSVVTLLMRGGVFNNHFTATFPQSEQVKKLKSVNT